MKNVFKHNISTRGWNNRVPNMANIHTWTICDVDLISAVVLVPHIELLKLSSYMICGTRVSVPVGVDPIEMGSSHNSLAFWSVVVIKMVSTMNGSVSLLLTDLASRVLAVAVAIVVVVVWRLGVSGAPFRSPTTIIVVTTKATKSPHGGICRRCLGAALQKNLLQLNTQQLSIWLMNWYGFNASDDGQDHWIVFKV
jgi:hypothetical protein